MAEVIRRCVDRALEHQAVSRTELYERARAVIGQFEDRRGADDVAEEHDAYLEGSFS